MVTALLDVVRWALFGLSHALGGSPGAGIIALSVLARLALLPWSLRAARRAAAAKLALDALRPRIAALQQRHAKDPRKLREAMLAEYRKAGVHPLGGISPGLLAIQIPIGWALYSVISTGLSASDTFLWIASLGRPDAVISVIAGVVTTLMGVAGPVGGSPPVSPLLAASIMGAISCLIVFHMSAAVGLYWASSSCVGILQNLLLRTARPDAAA